MLEEEERAIVDAGDAGAEAAVVALVVVLLEDGVFFDFPLHAEGRVGEHVVELVIGEVILGLAVAEGVAEFDVVERVAFDEHVGAADGVGFGVVVLAKEHQLRVGVELL